MTQRVHGYGTAWDGTITPRNTRKTRHGTARHGTTRHGTIGQDTNIARHDMKYIHACVRARVGVRACALIISYAHMIVCVASCVHKYIDYIPVLLLG